MRRVSRASALASPRRRTLAALSAAAVLAGVAATAPPSVNAAPAATKIAVAKEPQGLAKGHSYDAGRYIVTLKGAAAATYLGDIAGYPRTRPTAGKKLNPTRAEVIKYRDRLTGIQAKVAASVNVTVTRNLTVATNGFSAYLSAAQARTLAADSRVALISKSEKRQMMTTESPAYLGLTGTGSPSTDYLGLGAAGAGKNVIVGIVDSGIWPENPSFAGAELKRTAAGLPVPASGLSGTWWGPCQQGTNFSSQSCNSKVIGARFYLDGFGVKNLAQGEYKSPRDGSGHGSHTASTAAGNVVKNVSIDGKNMGTASGMAPAARIAVYKVCWEGKSDAGCFTEDIVAAIDDAVADGVDVINFSIGGGSESSLADPGELAFLNATAANVFVAASAGNSGPDASTYDHPSPWIATVAASSFRNSNLEVKLGNRTSYVGTSLASAPLPTNAPFVSATLAGLAGANADNLRRCFAGTLDPAKVAGKVVQCDRGGNGRVEKSAAVKGAGGIGMVLVNVGDNSLDPDYHFVPTVHTTDIPAIRDYAKTVGATVSFVVPAANDPRIPPTPLVAGFSSRGPSLGMDGDVIKPDLAAPGVGVLAAVSPPHNYGRSYDFYSGTSMSSPHVAGLAALLRSKNTSWTPSMVKSALMTTAKDHATWEGKPGDDPFAQGAGFVQPVKAATPGLVYKQTYEDYVRFLNGHFGVDLGDYGLAPKGLGSIDENELNLASIAEGAMAGTVTLTRTVTNIGPAGTFKAKVELPGIDAVVSPSTLALGAGESGSFDITFTTGNAEIGAFATGFLTWTGAGSSVRSPIAVRPVAIAAPTELSGDGASGSIPFDVVPGATGEIDSSVVGLLGAVPAPGSVTTGAFDDANPAPSAAVKAYPVVVTGSTTLVRVDVDATSASDDLDLYLYNEGGDMVAVSASGAADEQVTAVGLPAGTYTAYVHGFATPAGGAYALTTWAVGDTAADNASVTPNPAAGTLGETATLTLGWTGLDTTKRYLGWIGYTVDGTKAGDVTVVSVG